MKNNNLAFKPLNAYPIKDLATFRKLILTFQILGLLIVIFLYPEISYTSRLIFLFGLTIATFLTLFLVPRVLKGDVYLIYISYMLFSIGSIMIYRLEPSLAIKQVIWMIVGTFAYFITYIILTKLSGWENRIKFYFALTFILFLITIIFGSVHGGAQNWIVIGPISIQPTEFSKILLAFLIASFYSNYDKISKIEFKNKKIGKYFLMASVYIFLGFLFLQAELGTAIIFFALLFLSQFVYDKDYKMLIANFILALVGAVVAYILFDHIKIRVSIWLNPWEDINNTGYQITQSLFAIGSGGFFGSGIGMGRPDLIPRSYTDFIFSAICEEMGIFAGVGLIMLYLLLVYRAIKISLSQR